jgi:hypothetical protein
LPAAKGGEDGEGVEAVGEARQVDLVSDGNPGRIACRGFGAVGVDVDDHQASRAAGDADTELRVLPPPLLDAVLVEGGRVEAVAPAASA